MSACASPCMPSAADRPAHDRPAAERELRPHLLEPESLGLHIDQLFRAAWALCGSREEAEDLVQETFLNVLKRPRFVRNRDEIGYLLRALRNTYASRYRKAAQRPRERQLMDTDLLTRDDRDAVNGREIMEAIAGAPAQYRDAVIAVDLIGLSYREAARSLRTREATLTTRLHRGRQYVARALLSESGRSGCSAYSYQGCACRASRFGKFPGAFASNRDRHKTSDDYGAKLPRYGHANTSRLPHRSTAA